MKTALVALVAAVAAQPPTDVPGSRRIEVRVERVANREAGPADTCEAVQAMSAGSPLPFTFWSTLGEPGTGGRCGSGALPGATTQPSGATSAPFLIHEVSVVAGWDAGTMDPGPLGAVEIFLTLSSRQLTGFTHEGQPQYGAPVTERRVTRLEPGEEQVVPVAVDARGREALGVHEVLLRLRAGWAGRDGTTDYGAVAVTDATPGSEVVLDGGVAGRAGSDGSLLLPVVAVGQREVRMRGASGRVVSRVVSVVKGRTVLVAPVAADGGAVTEPSLKPAGRNAEGFEEYRRVRDGAIMVRIPEGEFLMGNLETEGAPLPHTVYVSAYLMDKLPVTVGRYRRYAIATGRPLPPDPYWGVHEDFPVAFVRWDEARAYCEWAGGRLPTEAEREKAARGTDGRMFPWGNEPPSPERAVFGRYWGQLGNDAVGIRPSGASPFGLLDSEGNMWEFCEDWYDIDYYRSSPREDPAGPKTGKARVVRGGSWDSRWVALSASKRNFAYTGYREGDFGFRCASDPPR